MARRFYPKSAVDAAAFAQQGSYGTSGDILDHVLFDSLPFAATTVRAQSTFFSVPVGGAFGAGTKTQVETNMALQGQLPRTQNLIVKAWSIALVGMVVGADLDATTVVSAFTNIVQGSVFELHLAGREFDTQVPGTVFLPSVYVNARTTIVDATDRTFGTGSIVTSGWMSLDIPVTIESSANFSVIQRTGSAIAALVTLLNTASDVLATQNAALQVRLKGWLTRGK